MASMFKELPSMSTLLSAYASISTFSMLIRTILNEMVPRRMREFITTKVGECFANFSSDFTFVIEDRWQAVTNETFRAIELYLPTRISSSTRSLLLGNNDNNNITRPPKPGIPVDAKVIDEFQGMRLEWILCEKETKKSFYHSHRRYFNLKCNRKDRGKVMESYLPHISRTAKSILNQRETLYIYTYDDGWESTVFKHPATFETLAMDPNTKKSIVEDLDLFEKRKEYFQNVGRAWKRGYLLYGPPGTGKSTLVAAMANYLRYNIYDLQLQNVRNDAELRRILTATTNRSILLIEDIDCGTKSRSRARSAVPKNDDESDNDQPEHSKLSFDPGVTLSGLLNFIDGLWSTCGDERIIIFTTNHKDKLDPALLRPGRMDVHIYMGHCTPAGFKKLAATYLGIKDHFLFKCIEDLIERIPITPAEAAQHLMICNEPNVALESLIEFLSLKGSEAGRSGAEAEEEEVIKKEVVKCAKEGAKVVCESQHVKEAVKKNEEIEMRSVYLT
uniref:ATP binding protein n=1 Tax=Rhizophora mucronata TaxID=61149 RepID=A0A2P2NJ97_RHIMU